MSSQDTLIEAGVFSSADNRSARKIVEDIQRSGHRIVGESLLKSLPHIRGGAPATTFRFISSSEFSGSDCKTSSILSLAQKRGLKQPIPGACLAFAARYTQNQLANRRIVFFHYPQIATCRKNNPERANKETIIVSNTAEGDYVGLIRSNRGPKNVFIGEWTFAFCT